MRREAFGRNGRDVPVIGQGTWNLERAPRAEAVAALRAGLDAGASHIDTAEMYGSGAAERIVAEAIAGRREEVFLVSKVLPYNASRAGTVAACEASLKRLGTGRLDCFLLLWPGSLPLEETFAGFEDLVRAGKILTWGVSNFDAADLDAALAALGGRRAAHQLVCNQVLYHLGERAIEHRVLPWCEREGLALVAYSPFGHDDFPADSSRGGRVLAGIAAAHGTSPRAVALAFLARSPSVFTIPKAARAAHASENAAAGALSLEPEEIVRIDEAFPRGRARASLPML